MGDNPYNCHQQCLIWKLKQIPSAKTRSHTIVPDMRAIVRRSLVTRRDTSEQIESSFKKLGNTFQSIERSRKELISIFGRDLLSEGISEKLKFAFEKRHPITHNLGVIDRKYLERVQQAEQEGREVRISVTEVVELLSNVFLAISLVHSEVAKS